MEKYPALNAIWLGIYGYTVRSRKLRDGRRSLVTDLVSEDDGHGRFSHLDVPFLSEYSVDVVRRIHKTFISSWDAVEFEE